MRFHTSFRDRVYGLCGRGCAWAERLRHGATRRVECASCPPPGHLLGMRGRGTPCGERCQAPLRVTGRTLRGHVWLIGARRGKTPCTREAGHRGDRHGSWQPRVPLALRASAKFAPNGSTGRGARVVETGKTRRGQASQSVIACIARLAASGSPGPPRFVPRCPPCSQSPRRFLLAGAAALRWAFLRWV